MAGKGMEEASGEWLERFALEATLTLSMAHIGFSSSPECGRDRSSLKPPFSLPLSWTIPSPIKISYSGSQFKCSTITETVVGKLL